jgi:hypothetical protein
LNAIGTCIGYQIITGEDTEDFLFALAEVKERVERGCLSGFDRNETGDYSFVIT